MQLYTINATPIKDGDDIDTRTFKCNNYKQFVASQFRAYGIDGFTIYQVDGYWQGVAEASFKIEVAIDESDYSSLVAVANQLKILYEQDSVMLTKPNNDVEFI